MSGMTCHDCGQQCPRTGPTQKYCPACSSRRDLLRKRLWVRTHPPSPQQQQRDIAQARRRLELSREAGTGRNDELKRGITWRDPDAPDLRWLLRISVPFSYATSKNHLYTMRRCGHIALRREVVAKRREIAAAVRSALQGRRVAHNKLWIDVLVQKPDHRGDAVNVIDLLCDAIKDATGLDDRWYCIRQLDWEIVKNEPKLIIGLGQDSEIDCQVCSYCGQVKPLDAFTKKAGTHLGVDRVCRGCRREGRILAARRGALPVTPAPRCEPECA